jgi:hypothetical protein
MPRKDASLWLLGWLRPVRSWLTERDKVQQRVLPSIAVCESRQIQTAGPVHKTRTSLESINSPPSARQRACRLS